MPDSQLDKEPLHLRYREDFLKAFLEYGSFKVGFECTKCESLCLRGHIFNNVNGALKHVEKVHTMERVQKKSVCENSKVLCNHCGEYISSTYYNRHVQRVHPDAVQDFIPHEKKWKTCLTCSVVFDCTVRKAEYNKHVLHCRNHPFKVVRNKNIPRQCDICGKVVRFLSKHKETHFNDEVPKYFCPDCPKSFTVKANFVNHMRLHKIGRNFKCEQCGKSFVLKHHLKNHMLSHTDEMPFKCSYCGRRFRMKHQLKAHVERIHEK